MGFGRPFQLTDLSIRELRDNGISDDVTRALAPLKARKFFSKGEFLASLGQLFPAPLSKGEQKLILKFSRRGLLRLERIIPNRSAREWVEALIFALVVAALVRTFLFAPFKIPSGSMVPTIEIGDHIFATMFNYGVPIPLTGAKLFPGRIERGDIVIFPYPLDPEVDYIKRVVALPGETVRIEGTSVFIDGRKLREPYAYYDTLVLAHYEKNGDQPEVFGPLRIPAGKVFVMGDNRFNSSDSRVWGFVDAATIKGKGQIIYWSHDPNGGWFSGYRFGRIGSLLK